VDVSVRDAEPADLDRLSDVEVAADTLVVPLGITDLPPPPAPAERAAAWRVLVTGRPVTGFAVLERVDGDVHLEQLSVHPAAGRCGSAAVTDPGPEPTALVARESALGPAVHGRRVLVGRTPRGRRP
jgi:hypothetical protein